MDIYLKQQQQMNSQIIPENQISMQNINYTPMLKQNNNNYESSSQLQTIPQQIPQSTIMYPLNSVKANPNAFNMLHIEQQGINDSNQHQTPSTLFPGNNTELSSLTNNILSNDSQENAKKNTISISPSSDSILENQSENNSQDTKSETTNNSEIDRKSVV